jgi:hypothetical protein
MRPAPGQTYANPAGLSFLVETVTDTDDFYLVELIQASDAEDMSAPGIELDPDEFADFCAEHGLSLRA